MLWNNDISEIDPEYYDQGIAFFIAAQKVFKQAKNRTKVA